MHNFLIEPDRIAHLPDDIGIEISNIGDNKICIADGFHNLLYDLSRYDLIRSGCLDFNIVIFFHLFDSRVDPIVKYVRKFMSEGH